MPVREIREPKQKRSIEKKNRIKTAALQLISEIGYHDANTNKIAERAGVNIATLYSYYSDKKMIFLELLEDFQKIYYERVYSNEIETACFRGAVRDCLVNAIDAFDGYEAVFREGYLLQCRDDDFAGVNRRWEELEIEGIKNLLERLEPEFRARDRAAAAVFIHSLVVSAVNRFILHGLPLSRDELADGLADTICLYLRDKARL